VKSKSVPRGGVVRVFSFQLYKVKLSKLLISYALIPRFPAVCKMGVESVPLIVANLTPDILYILNSKYVVSSEREFTINSPFSGPLCGGICCF
jgi:hypothetical protein